MSGPNVLCLMCGAVANHTSLLCEQHRWPSCLEHNPTKADLLYMAWRVQRIMGKSETAP